VVAAGRRDADVAKTAHAARGRELTCGDDDDDVTGSRQHRHRMYVHRQDLAMRQCPDDDQLTVGRRRPFTCSPATRPGALTP